MKIGDIVVYTGESNEYYTKNKSYMIYKIDRPDPFSDDNKYGGRVKCWIKDDEDIPVYFGEHEATDSKSGWWYMKDLRKLKIQTIEFLGD